MTLTEVAEVIAMFKTRWPRATWASDSALEARMWHLTIGDITLAQVQAVLPALVQNSEFPPDPSLIRSAVFAASGQGPLPDLAWGYVQRVLRHEIEFTALPLPIKQAVKDIGGMHNLRNSEKPQFDRKAFIDAYTVRRNEAITSPDFAQMIGSGFAALGAGA